MLRWGLGSGSISSWASGLQHPISVGPRKGIIQGTPAGTRHGWFPRVEPLVDGLVLPPVPEVEQFGADVKTRLDVKTQ